MVAKGRRTFKDVEWKDYTITFTVDYTYFYSKGRMYMPNGDPGYPDEEELEITDMYDLEVYDDSDKEVTDTQVIDEAKDFAREHAAEADDYEFDGLDDECDDDDL